MLPSGAAAVVLCLFIFYLFIFFFVAVAAAAAILLLLSATADKLPFSVDMLDCPADMTDRFSDPNVYFAYALAGLIRHETGSLESATILYTHSLEHW